MTDEAELAGEMPELVRLAEKVLNRPVKLDLLAYCPTMDLLALATEEERVDVYRINGQRVIGVTSKTQKAEVEKLQWKPNGQLLAVAWKENGIRLVSPESGKDIYEMHPAADRSCRIILLAWAVNFLDSAGAKSRADVSHRGVDDVLGQAIQQLVSDAPPDLPKSLAMLDVDALLPRISPLSSGSDEDVFSSRANLDAMFHPQQASRDEAVDVLITGLEDGSVHLSIYDRFEIGTFKIGLGNDRLKGCRPILHASHPFSSTHALLVRQDAGTSFLPFDLRFFSRSGEYIALLAAKSTQLQNLLRYIGQVQKAIQSEWKSCQELPARFIQSIDGELKAKNEGGFIPAAYQLVVTGICSPLLRDWLVEIVSERGHKRWDKAVASGYDKVRRLVHENLLPALERCGVVVSRLRGLSRCNLMDSHLGLPVRKLEDVLEGINCLNLLSHRILKYAGTESRQFRVFSDWLRHEIDVQSADPPSFADDQADRDRDTDYPRILGYIQGPLTSSKIARLIPASSSKPAFNTRQTEVSLYARFQEDLKEIDAGSSSGRELLSLGDINAYLRYHCELVFQSIAESQKRNVSFGAPVLLAPREMEHAAEMRMVVEGQLSVTYVAIREPLPTPKRELSQALAEKAPA
ncbi:MAG: hypothetical protein M1826_005909 [Phylliscum demangeonii]|nr:MAG: hypothetical protein M1826_005909 [Phylliscum demangeonii]